MNIFEKLKRFIRNKWNNEWIDDYGVIYSFDRMKLIKAKSILYKKIGDEVIEVKKGIIDLTEYKIINGCKIIGHDAFMDCRNLINIHIPNSVVSIEAGSFCGCCSLTSVAIPDSVTSIVTVWQIESLRDGFSSYYTFAGCLNLKEFIVSERNQYYSAIDGVLFNKDKTTVISFPQSKSENIYIIHSSVILIGKFAFNGCTGLTSITIPNSVTSIGSYAFGGCTGLTSTIIGKSVTSIGDYAFGSCTGLTAIYSKNPTPPSISFANITYNTDAIVRRMLRKEQSSISFVNNTYDTFYNVNKKTCKLYVPKGSKEAYQKAWGFENIIEE